MAQHPNASKQTRWLNLMLRWQRCRHKLTVREFCQRHGLSEPSFYTWRSVLRQRGLLQDSPSPPAPTSPAFVKLTVAAEPASADTAIDLVLSERCLLRVRAGFDPDTLRALVRLLEEPLC
jgi:transposase-like protein